MGKRIFVSYSTQQGNWVWDRLVPCLRAGDADVLIDRERFEAGKAVVGQMDRTQDAADAHVLVLSPDYCQSDYCVHEMNRAIDQDPEFANSVVIPIVREPCSLPERVKLPEPLYVNLHDDQDAQQWGQLLAACEADLGSTAPDWLRVRDELRRLLQRDQSVNLVVYGQAKWQELIEHLRAGTLPGMGVVDLESGATASRRAFVREVLRACGVAIDVPEEPEDLVRLHQALSEKTSLSQLVLCHADMLRSRPYHNWELFGALRYLMMYEKKLVLLAQSRSPFATLLPQDHPLSSMDMQTVELRGRP